MKKNDFSHSKRILALILLVFISFSCTKEDDNNDVEIVNREIFNLFQEVYLWYQQLPESVDPGSYDSPQQFVDAIKYDQLDGFSSVISKTEFQQYFEQGRSFGHGFSVGADPQTNIRVAFIYQNTTAYSEGVRRSWIIKEINGTRATASNYFDLLGPSDEQVTNDFVFQMPDGTEKEVSLTKEVVEINTVLHDEIIERNGLKIGYIVFQDFISAGIQQIDSVFEDFASANIDELILDLRYNGGGSILVAEHIADWILGLQNSGEPFYSLVHNDKRSAQDTTASIEQLEQALAVNSVVFITTRNTASASEMLLNGFKPYLTAQSVGTATRGKPVGQEPFVFRDYDYAVLPITFKYVNANGNGDFFDGIQADIQASDDITKMFGNPEEASLQAAIKYLTTGSTATLKRFPEETKILVPENGRGIHQFMRAH